MKREKILITAALPYANGSIHFGHLAGCYLPADCYARFQRRKGRDTLFICGSDEYGVAIQLSAEIAKRNPKEHAEIFHVVNQNLFKTLNISFDHYSRTTWEKHKEAVYQYFNDLLKNGYIEEKETKELYSEQDKKFLADRYVVGTCPRCGFEEARGDECTKCGASFEAVDLKNPRSKLTNSPLTLKPTVHWYLRLDLFKEKLSSWLATKNWKPNVMNFVKSYIDDLRPRAITRDTTWGVPLPQRDGKVLYVWFEAPIGYISATKELGELRNKPELWKEYWMDPDVKLVNFIGKDNIPFHAVIFPAMTMGQDLPIKLVDELPANEFYHLEGRQFSKSDGWYIDVEDFLKRYSPDQIRYTLAANAPETSDSEFTWKDFQQRCNSELVGKFGNFIHRTLVFIRNTIGVKIPIRGTLSSQDNIFLQEITSLMREIESSYETFKLRRATQLVMELAQIGNVYFDSKRPWQDAKSPETKERMETTLSLCLECVKCLALASEPIVPQTTALIWEMLGLKDKMNNKSWSEIMNLPLEDMKLEEPKTLFRKIEDKEIEEEASKLKSVTKAPSQAQEKKPTITIDDVRKVELRICKILSSERVPKSKKLLRLEVDLGAEKRQVVAGIGEQFKPEDLIGKQVVMVANLAPSKLMGVESQGMLLVASSEGKMELLESTLLPGSEIS